MSTTARLRVLDLRDTDEIGGPGKTILETFRAIDRDRFDLHVAVFRRGDEQGDTPFMTAARDIGLPLHELRAPHQYHPRLLFETSSLVRRLGFDIVHSHEVKSDVIVAMSCTALPVSTVATLHGWIGNSAKQRALAVIDRRLLRRFDRVVAVSGRIRDQLLAAGVPASRLHLIHNAIVLRNYAPTGDRGALEALVGAPLPRPVVITVGRLSAEKGHADLVDALAILTRRGQPVSAVFLGDGPERPRLEGRIAAAGLTGAVHLPGYIAQPQRYLESADIMVLPSHTEGLPNAALEALALGVPVLATRVGGTPEVIEDGVNGRLVPAQQPEAMATALAAFVADPAPLRAMASHGRDDVAARFDFGARTRRMEALYADLGRRRT